MRALRWQLTAVVLLAIGVLAGCSESGPKRYRVTGSATIAGKPIPYGEVLFTPDGSKKNSGPQGIAPIRDGKYDTSAANGTGVAGGPTVLLVNGMSGPKGKTLCEYQLKADLPREDTTYDVDVPKTAAVKKPVKEI